jgi:ParB-like chromosome segregation protein Spo0J
MRIIRDVNVSSIKMDRYPLNKSTLNLIKYLESGGSVPPIKIATLKKGNYLIRDGRHRITAFKLLGWEKIEAKFSIKPLQERQ